ncbi:hypothetical protein [Ideonella sp.]|uniref:hypothetical protein n=1 Tax=Ideonella sp. TaxID=1929293 RepID=UPI003BB55D77
MMFARHDRLRRPSFEELRRCFGDPPSSAWRPPAVKLEGVAFDLHSRFELSTMRGRLAALLPGLPPSQQSALERRVHIQAAGAYRSTESSGPCGSRLLEHPEQGLVYLDLHDRTFVHLGPHQVPAAPLPEVLRQAKLDWRLEPDDDGAVLSVRGALSLDVRLCFAPAGKSSPTSGAVVQAVLDACLPGWEALSALGLPFKQLAGMGLPRAIETWLVDASGMRSHLLAAHRVEGLCAGPVAPAALAIPEGFGDLRAPALKTCQDGSLAPRVTIARRHPRPQGLTANRGVRARVQPPFPLQTVATAWQGTDKRARASEPELPQCQPATLHASASLEVQQSLLDAIQTVLNGIGSRLSDVRGARVNPNDPEETRVRLDIDWLEQMARKARALPSGDGLFCLLRDPPADDGLGGGNGLLDRMAESLARELMARENPLPLGGDDQPVTLPVSVQAEIAALAADASVSRKARYDALAPTTRVRVREAVLEQRIGNVRQEFEGNFGETVWPMPQFDLLHVRLQLESMAMAFADDRELLRGLRISLRDDRAERPQIEFELALQRVEARLTMERWPGANFWVTAGGVLVALAILAPAAVGGLVLTLMGLGPLGLIVLSMLISGAPVAAVAGGAALLAVTTYIVWDVSDLRLAIDRPVVRSSVAPDVRSGPDAVVLDSDSASLEGDITASVASRIPSGVHQIMDAVVNLALDRFEDQVRAVLVDRTVQGLNQAMLQLPHFRLPPPFDVQVDVVTALPGTGTAVDTVGSPEHRLLQHATNGMEDAWLTASTVTLATHPFPGMSHLVTQVDPDLRPFVTDAVQRMQTESRTPRIGWGLSQNLLNANVFARWLDRRYHIDYTAAQAEEAFAALVQACPECAVVGGPLTVHAWAASAPQVHVTPRAALERPERPYLLTCWPDVRLCLGGVRGKAASLELRFSIRSLAHLGLGTIAADGKLSMFSFEQDFVHVLFDDRAPHVELSPIETQGLEPHGAGFGAVAALDGAGRLALVQALQPLALEAARRLLHIDGVHRLSFVDDAERVDQQVYDGMLQLEVQPRRTSLVAVATTHGSIGAVLPRRDAEGLRLPPVIDLDSLTCADGVALRSLLG